MPECANCKEKRHFNKLQLCKKCSEINKSTSKDNSTEIIKSASKGGMNEYLQNSMSNEFQSVNTGENNNNTSVNNTITTQVNDNSTINTITPSTPLSELTTGNLISIINESITNSIKSIEEEINVATDKQIIDFGSVIYAKVSNLENRVKMLESDIVKKTDENAIMKSIIRNMQKHLNQQDSDARNLNIIISGMREDEIEIMNGNDASITLKSDHEKVTWLLKYLKSEHFTDQMIAEFSIQRLGKKREGFNRIVKIKLKSVKDKDAFLVNAPTECP